ncbi:hypothetical protein PHSY_004316 [Pseudozyma hubeiensis SY62]|uniref:Uncharacterized protein n=1 Tax=Pseudozyma hubeiensis (strain SY62) TaxID=1305764 RepID=R9P656_PSEHS|nr:hypothetical protein PHSY_004316 [Pseudozyma hubeiensis SY62]GAC96732.1 hypothetical protein PHSY_004316 [Pseudozyma hubeiensis SY62]
MPSSLCRKTQTTAPRHSEEKPRNSIDQVPPSLIRRLLRESAVSIALDATNLRDFQLFDAHANIHDVSAEFELSSVRVGSVTRST